MVVRAREVPIPAEFAQGDYVADSVFRGKFHRWLANLWAFKDAQIDGLLAPSVATSTDAVHAKT